MEQNLNFESLRNVQKDRNAIYKRRLKEKMKNDSERYKKTKKKKDFEV